MERNNEDFVRVRTSVRREYVHASRNLNGTAVTTKILCWVVLWWVVLFGNLFCKVDQLLHQIWVAVGDVIVLGRIVL